jgi:hypothetical protein
MQSLVLKIAIIGFGVCSLGVLLAGDRTGAAGAAAISALFLIAAAIASRP